MCNRYAKEVNIGFISSSYTVDESQGFVEVEFGVLEGKINQPIIVDFSFNEATALSEAHT